MFLISVLFSSKEHLNVLKKMIHLLEKQSCIKELVIIEYIVFFFFIYILTIIDFL